MPGDQPENRIVFKIVASRDWQEASRRGAYRGSADDARDGYIHLSVAHQLAGTAEKHFRGREDLVLVAFDAAALGEALRWEPSRGGALFPHFYGELPAQLALWTRPLPLGQDGIPVLPENLLQC